MCTVYYAFLGIRCWQLPYGFQLILLYFQPVVVLILSFLPQCLYGYATSQKHFAISTKSLHWYAGTFLSDIVQLRYPCGGKQDSHATANNLISKIYMKVTWKDQDFSYIIMLELFLHIGHNFPPWFMALDALYLDLFFSCQHNMAVTGNQ